MFLLNRFRYFDLYTKPSEDCRVKTSFGGLITVISFVVIGALFISELFSFFSLNVSEQLFVDSTSSDARVEINFDITFHRLPCDFVTIDVMGINGESQATFNNHITKQYLDADGNNIEGEDLIKQVVSKPVYDFINTTNKAHTDECGSCYGASSGCCNTCDDVREAYRIRGWIIDDISVIKQCEIDNVSLALKKYKGQGCRLYGQVEVEKVGGNLHVAPGVSRTDHNYHYHDFKHINPKNFDTSHTFNQFSFGKAYPKKSYPLNGKRFISNRAVMYQYYLKVIPTTYTYSDNGNEGISYQFSITKKEKDTTTAIDIIPGVFILYEFSPLMVRYQEKQRSFTNFAVSLCAIIGGVFTVASLLDSFIYSGARAMQRKFQSGKIN